MSGLSSIVAGGVLLAFAFGFVFAGWSAEAAMVMGGAGLFLLYRGYQGMEINSLDDLVTPVEFASDPAGAIVDEAADRLENFFADAVRGPEADTKPFDPDAVIARYLAANPDRPAPEQPAAVRPSFGRKGL